jgi:hypothetical protein
VRSTRGSSKVSLLTCHTCVEKVDGSRDFSLVDNKLSVLNLSKLLSVNHRKFFFLEHLLFSRESHALSSS